ncbi:hypothetical protein HPB52_006111 [Rhipicephalus sanguineus]|uniref:Uncharacterized protein n=1 Tax=Rhipicephalus sanguineus TaxID=34632 RepID=A0A9D4QLA0_RHISA|nr:hypothetical protein HPB52_006111 [Rhipicephalus sanguineus]
METKVAPSGFFRKLWQKLFRRVEDAYGFRQPPGTPSTTASPTRNAGLVEAVDITTPAGLDVLRGSLDCNRKVQKSSVPEDASTTCATPTSVAATVAAGSRAAPLRPLPESRGRSLSDGLSIFPFYSINTDPLDVQLIEADGAAINAGGDAEFHGYSGVVTENVVEDEPRFIDAFWQWRRSADDSAQERPRRVMGMPVRLDPAVVCDMDSGPFDRSCHQNVFFTASSE